MNLSARERCRDAGLFVLRVGIGLSFVGYGAPKLIGGPPVWEDLLLMGPGRFSVDEGLRRRARGTTAPR